MKRIVYLSHLACEATRVARAWSAALKQHIGSLEISMKEVCSVQVGHSSSDVYETLYQSHLP